jgi:hypothetical protein
VNQPSLFDGDITRNKHRGNPESDDAFKKIEPARLGMQRRVMAVCAANALFGTTLKEIVAKSGLPIQTVSGRLAELKAAGMLEKTGERREGCAVLRPTPKGWEFNRAV